MIGKTQPGTTGDLAVNSAQAPALSSVTGQSGRWCSDAGVPGCPGSIYSTTGSAEASGASAKMSRRGPSSSLQPLHSAVMSAASGGPGRGPPEAGHDVVRRRCRRHMNALSRTSVIWRPAPFDPQPVRATVPRFRQSLRRLPRRSVPRLPRRSAAPLWCRSVPAMPWRSVPVPLR